MKVPARRRSDLPRRCSNQRHGLDRCRYKPCRSETLGRARTDLRQYLQHRRRSGEAGFSVGVCQSWSTAGHSRQVPASSATISKTPILRRKVASFGEPGALFSMRAGTSSTEGGCSDLDPSRGSGCGAKLTCNRLVRLAKTVRLPAPLIAAVRCHSPSSGTRRGHLRLERASPAAQPTSPRHKRSRSSSIGSLKPAGRDTRADVRIKALRRARRETGLPGITKLEVRIGVLVAVPNGVMVRCVDMHSGRPALARRLSVLAGIRNLSKRRHREDCTESDGGKKDFHCGSPELRRCL